MKAWEQTYPRIVRLEDVPRLDPILIVFNDTAPGAGTLIVECYCWAWAARFNAMGDGYDLWKFMLKADDDYLSNSLLNKQRPASKREKEYLRRIVVAIKDWMNQPSTSSGSQS